MNRNLIAILRGVTADEIDDIVEILLAEGITKIEVPLNSPDPFKTIEKMLSKYKGQGVFGAGTVLNVEQVTALAELGADLIVSPNCNPKVIAATKAAGMLSYPGVMTPSECFMALEAGADGLKFFPGDLVGPVGLNAMRAILPKQVDCYAVGGANASNFGQWVKAGATGFGIGSALYKIGDTPQIVQQKAKAIVTAFDLAVK
ncbi:MAG: 2-dehydro-3-deoxy-6-phosphogalactonate aldolase [Rhizobiales bacterium]|nr:2-dehydro-3-deoxy-6-phosphogalactonate aldolase [Hyphomicrobiales bacterium]NRB14530.1 2-dehydro-3-deoxy-6-phosphogalactonate aldolase [Hyphomicrobiales bacterium]